MTPPYIRESFSGIWVRAETETFAYSDGDEIEARLLSLIERATDISTTSPELASAILDWPTEYHLSSARHNLLRPFDIGPDHKVLELGCGCGSMTRYLGETGATVIAVEGSRRRAQIAAARCRDLPNVTIYCDNLVSFTSEEKFDFVTLIGVLEYAPKFVSGNDPVLAVLNQARSFMKNEGVLALAIENQLGIKYLNGCNEDHVGIPYFGINNLYGKGDPVTYGRHALAEKLEKSGLPIHQFFFPFPDYKLPGLILSEAALRDTRLNVADLLIANTGRNYPETHHRAFAEDMAWHVTVENHLLADLANSFLILAKISGPIPPQTDWLAKMYSRGRRRPCYQVETTIGPVGAGNLAVRKRKLFPDAPNSDKIRHAVMDSAYLDGNLLVGNIHKAMAREANIDVLSTCFAPWLKFLLTHAARNEMGEQVLPGHFVDCTPSNLVETSSGELHYFDAEWACKDPIPLAWIVIRGITYSLIDCLDNPSVSTMTYRQFISQIAEKWEIFLQEGDFSTADQCEASLVAQCHVDSASKPRFAGFLDSQLYLTGRLTNHNSDCQNLLAWHQAELARVKKTLSWRITAPLRVIWNLYLKLIGKNRKLYARAA